MKGRTFSASGSLVAQPKQGNRRVIAEAKERAEGKEGLKPSGSISRLRLDRPGRKRGGRVGSELGPLSSAARSDDGCK